MLFLRELKKVVCSISYILFVTVISIALYSQGALDFSGDIITEPQVGGNFGIKNEEVPEIIMPAAVQALYDDFQENHYKTYPIGLYKNVKLNQEQQMSIAEILSDITGIDRSKFYNAQKDASENGNDGFVIGGDNVRNDGNGGFVISVGSENAENSTKDEIALSVRSDMSYSEFKEKMQKVDDILGGGSDYSKDSLIGFGTVPIGYEEAVERYELAKNHDKLTGGYARLFSDYAVAMVLSMLPVFPAVIISMKDKRAKMSELIYTRRIAGAKIVLVRYLAIISSVMLPVIVLSYISNASVWNMYSGMELDYLAPLKYDLIWIMPSVMISAAVGMCLTELSNTPIAIAVQGLWWFLDINMGYKSTAASYSLFRLAPRHNAGVNSFFRTQDFIDNFQHLINNRVFFAGLSVLLIAVTIFIYEAKRKGKLNGNYKIKKYFTDIRNSKNQSEA